MWMLPHTEKHIHHMCQKYDLVGGWPPQNSSSQIWWLQMWHWVHIPPDKHKRHGRTANGNSDTDDRIQVGTSVAWAKGHEGNSSYSDYALFGAPGCFTWRGNLYGRQTGRFLGEIVTWLVIHIFPLAGSIRESQTALGDSNFLRWAAKDWNEIWTVKGSNF